MLLRVLDTDSLTGVLAHVSATDAFPTALACRAFYSTLRARFPYCFRSGKIEAFAGSVARATLLQVSRAHAVTVLHGLIFDATVAQPLPLTPANLTRCIGATYQEVLVRGYRFEKIVKKSAKRGLAPTSPDAKRSRES